MSLHYSKFGNMAPLAKLSANNFIPSLAHTIIFTNSKTPVIFVIKTPGFYNFSQNDKKLSSEYWVA